MEKPEWRRHLRQLLEKNKVDAHDQLNAHLLDFLKDQAGVWAGYVAQEHEPSLSKDLFTSQKMKWVFPVVEKEKLRWFSVGPQGFQKGSFGIMEPVKEGAREFQATELSGALIPGLGFDRTGVRLGWGKGFYDRALAGLKLVKVGMAWSFQFVEKLPAEEHDLQVDVVMTEKGIMKIEDRG